MELEQLHPTYAVRLQHAQTLSIPDLVTAVMAGVPEAADAFHYTHRADGREVLETLYAREITGKRAACFFRVCLSSSFALSEAKHPATLTRVMRMNGERVEIG